MLYTESLEQQTGREYVTNNYLYYEFLKAFVRMTKSELNCLPKALDLKPLLTTLYLFKNMSFGVQGVCLGINIISFVNLHQPFTFAKLQFPPTQDEESNIHFPGLL